MWSPSSRHWCVGLSASQLTLARPGTWWGRPPADCDSVACTPHEGAEPWRAVLDALAKWLAASALRRPALRVVLSGRFVRWQLLPWRPEIARPRELAAYAALHFREVFGPVAEQWQVLYAAPAPGHPLSACAIDRALMESLRDVCATGGARLAAVTPYFASASGHWCRRLDRKSAWFALVEPDNLSLGLLQERRWTSLRTQRLDGDWRVVLPRMIAQAGLAAGVVQPATPVFLAGAMAQPEGGDALQFSWLQPPVGRATPGCRLALGL